MTTADRDAQPGFWSTTRIAVLVVVIGFACNFVARGVVDTYLVFMLPLEREFGWRHSDLTQVYSAYLITLGVMSPLTGAILDGWGPHLSYLAGVALMAGAMLLASQTSAMWQLYLAIGVMCGMASSLMGMVPAAALIGRWFDRQMSVGVALAYAGFGSGMLLVVPLAQAGIDAFGWRETYGIMFMCLLAMVPLLLLLPWSRIAVGAPGNPRARAPAQRSNAARTGETHAQWTVRSAIGTLEFWLLVQAFFFTAVAAYLTSVQVIAFLIDRGYPPLDAALAFGIAGMLSICGVMMSGWAMVRFGVRRATVVSFVGTFIGIAGLCFFAFWPHAGWVLLYMLAFGTSQGARGPVISALNARIFARGKVSSIYGLIFMIMSFGSAFGAWLSGVLHDLTGDYTAAFIVACFAVFLAAAPFVVTRRLVEARELPPPSIRS
ncbi:MFS transporter [Aquamicrobium sp. LC103]|uniref:MFS transporter n=1 Tax=Aquamicrobium sp. LC103 TaxID=1120658 RepID=UPI00063ECF25|nr:MFS transporter [Aquamicrobium sp. LC103]TKT74796.1 MFS transporter [Aquamicrobium sp. LC103]